MKLDNSILSGGMELPGSSEESVASILLSLQASSSSIPASNSTDAQSSSTPNTLLQPPAHHCLFNPCTFCSEASKSITTVASNSVTATKRKQQEVRSAATRQNKRGRENVDANINADTNPTHADEEEDDATPRFQQPRSELDLYTPRWVRYSGHRKEGLCGLCPEKWLQLKDSAFWYHKQFFHGVSSTTGTYFAAPSTIRTVWSVSEKAGAGYLAFLMNEGLCHSCNEWIPLFKNKKRYNYVAEDYADLDNTFLKMSNPDDFKTLPLLLASNPIRISVGILQNGGIFVPGSVNVPSSLMNEVILNRAGEMGGVWFRHSHKCHS